MGKLLVNKIRGKNLQASGISSPGLLGFFKKFRGENAMAKINVQRSSGMNVWAKSGLVMLCAMLVSMFMSGGLCSPVKAEALTYYLKGDTTTSLGFDGTANLPAAQTTAVSLYRGTMVTAPATATSYRPTSIATGSQVLLRGYVTNVSALPKSITAISGSVYIRTQTNTDTWTFHVYDYNPTTGAKTLVGTSNTVTGLTGSTNTTRATTYTISGGTYVLPANNMLMFEVVTNPSATSTNTRIYYGGTSATTGSWINVTETLVGAPTVQWTSASQSKTESGDMTVTAQLSASSTVDTIIPFTMTGTATNGTDYTITGSPITIPAGSTSGAVTISITDEMMYELDETVIVTMGAPTNANIGATTVHTATITNDDAYPTVSWSSAAQASVSESGPLTAVAQLSNPSYQAVTVPFTVSGPATSGLDYVPLTSTSLTIATGDTVASVPIGIIEDALDESNETVILTIGVPTNADPGATTVHTATITDDDDATTTGVLYNTPWQLLGSGTVATLPAMNLTKTTGLTNPLLVVQVTGDFTAATTTFQPTVRYAGVALTRITSTDTGSRQKVWIGYLNAASLAPISGSQPVTVTWGTAPTSGCGVSAAFYSRVDQTTPVTASTAQSSDTTSITTPSSSPINVISGGYGIYGLNRQATALGTVVAAAGYFQPLSVMNNTTHQLVIGTALQNSTGQVNPLPTWPAARYGFVSLTLRPDTVNNFTVPGAVTVAAAGKDRVMVTAPYTSDVNANNTLSVEYKLTTDGSYTLWQNLGHSTSPYSTMITALLAGTSYDVRVTYFDAEGANGPASPTSYSVVYTVTTRSAGSASIAQTWERVINDTTTRAAGPAVNLSGNFAVNMTNAPNGSNRVMVVAVTHINGAASTAPPAPTTPTYNGKNLRLATTNRGTSGRMHTWIYYLRDDAGVMDGNSYPLNISWPAGLVSTKIDVYAAVFTNVDQIAPIGVGNNLNNTANTVTMSTSAAMNVPANSLAVYVLNVVNSANTTIPTWTNNVNWRAPNSDEDPHMETGTAGTYGYSQQLAVRALPLSFTTDNAVTSSRSTASRYAISAIVLPPLAVSLTNGATLANSFVHAGDVNQVADAFDLTGSGAITNIQVTGNAYTTNTNVSAIKIWRKEDANVTQYSAGDTLIGSGSFGAIGDTPVNITLTQPEAISSYLNYIITYDITPTAIANGTSVVLTGKVTATTPMPSNLSDTGGVVTLMPTVTVGNGANPANARLWKASTATNLNAFTLQHNGTAVTDDDTISNITVNMSPQYISGGSGGTVTKFKLMEIVDATGNTVYGSMNLPATGDTWNIPVTGLVATPTLTTYYVRVSTADDITPSATDTSGTPTGYYSPITGLVTSLIHSKGNNEVVNNDTGSAALTIDVEKPNGPASATATTGTGAFGTIDLVWDAADDTPAHSGTLHPTTSYVIRRSLGDGVQPDPGCTSTTDNSTDLATVPGVTINYVGRSVTDINLISDNPTRYYYRVCAKDSLGNISAGATSYANAKVQSICDRPPSVTLAYEDGGTTAGLQIIKSSNSAPFKLQVANNDIGTCPDAVFNVELDNVVGNESHFNKLIAGSAFPSTVTVGTGGSGASTGKTVDIIVTGIEAAGVQQLETYKFAVKLTNGNHNNGAPYSYTSPQVTGLLNDMPPIVHNSANMAKYQYGSWGQTYTCATCHSNSTTNIKGVFQVISTPIGRRNVVFTKTSSTTNDSDGVYSNDQRPNKNGSNQVCNICHHQTRQHQYTASKPFGGPNNDETYNPDHHNSRDCVRCHTHNTAFRSIYGLCGDCHGFKATGYSPVNKSTMVKDLTNALGPNPPNYGSHLRHNTAQITCGACHSSTNHGLATTAWSGDNILEIGFNASKDTFAGFNPSVDVKGGTFYGTNNLNQPFSWQPGAFTNLSTIADYNNSCSTYCHGGGSWKAGGNIGSNTTPIWVGTKQVECGTCHNATGLIPPESGSHAKHSASTGAGLGIKCTACHSTYNNYSTSPAHINGQVEWGFAVYTATYTAFGKPAARSGSTDQPAPTPTNKYGTCSSLYCHSNVQGASGTGKPTTYASHTWGDTTWPAGETRCGYCHVYPNTTGSHSSHENATVQFDCHVCHNNGGTTSPLNHANRTINFEFVGLGMNTVYSRGNNVAPGTAYGTCSASDCHGRFTRVWGTPDSGLDICEKCHGSATSPGGFYNTRGPTGTLSVYSTGVGVHDIHVQNLNSPRKSTFARYTSFAAGFSCKQCHNSSPTGPFTAGHIDTALPAEVPFNNASTIAHRGDLFNYYSTPSYSFVTQSCSAIWCHGAGMHSNRATHEYAGTTPPVRTNPKFNTPFLVGNAADCSKCHAMPPAAANVGSTHYGKTLETCITCHQHVSPNGLGFSDKSLHVNGEIEGGCDGCHGNPPITANPGDILDPPTNALGAGLAGAHNSHQLIATIGTDCYTCHNAYSAAMPSTNLEIGFNGLNGQVKSGSFTGYTGSVGGPKGPKWLPSSAGTDLIKTNVQTVVCTNVYCHGGGSAAPNYRPVLGGGNDLAPEWSNTLESGGSGISCGNCHGIDAANAPSGGSHLRHAQTVSSLTCESCHGMTEDNGTHVNAAVNWRLDRSDFVIGRNATYNNLSGGSLPGLAPRANGSDYRTCNNVYCHSTVQGTDGFGDPTQYITPKWGDNGSMLCGSCHKDMANDASPTGSHLKHANATSGMNVPCGYCHQDAGSGFNEKHADGNVFVNFTSYIGGAYSVGTVLGSGREKIAGSSTFGSCSATFCHGTADTPAWGTVGTLLCNDCHSAKVDDASWSGNHKIHYNYSTMPTSYTQTVQDLSTPTKYRFNCAHCHDDNVAKHSLKPANDNAAARVFFGISSATPVTSSRRGTYTYGPTPSTTDNGFKSTDGTCNASYCHSNGRGGAPFNASLKWTTAKSAGTNCTLCHDTSSKTGTASQLSGKHDKHMNPLNNSIMGAGNGFKCSDCHARTITSFSNLSVANKGKHVNAFLDYSGKKAGKNHDGITKICSNVYCHSNGNPNALAFVNMTGFKVWATTSTAITTCNKCHGRSNATGYPDYANGGASTATSNLHEGHMIGLSSTTACADCHRKTAEVSVANRFRPYSTTHLSGGPNVVFNKTLQNIGSNAAVNTVGFQVTCSNIVCHGSGAPVWGAKKTGSLNAGQKTCTKCHGDATATDYLTNYSSATIAPGANGAGTDTSMVNSAATSPRVGAHQRHLLTDMISNPIKCGECHVPVTTVRSGNHWNYSTATLTFNGRAKFGGDSPYVSRTNGIMQCTNTYCHTGKYNSGTTIAPFWNMTGLVKETGTTVAACTKCHAMAPTGYANHVALSGAAALSTIVGSCQSCHSNISSSATNVSNAFVDKNLHVNGSINYTMACDSCHSYDTTNGGTAWGKLPMYTVGEPGYTGANPESYGAHVKHIQYMKTRLTAAGFINQTGLHSGDTWASPGFVAICGSCHSTNDSFAHSLDKSNNRRQITFGAGGRQFGAATPFYNGSSHTSSGTIPKSCSNIDCHYKTSPIWSTY